MDLLTDIFQQAGLRRRLLDVRGLPDGAALKFPCDKSLGLHVVTEGRLYLHAPNRDEPLALAAGDIALMARGCEHVLSTRPAPGAATVETVVPRLGAPAHHDPGSGGSRIISGAYQLWNTPVHPLFAEMPDWFVLRADAVPRLGPLALAAGLLQQEVQSWQLGSDMAVHGLVDMLFTCLMREMIATHAGAGATWCRAVQDPQIGRAVALLHDDVAQAWTLEELARRAGLSRTGLADRFRRAMGDTPLNYLRVLRMQRAMRLLSESDRKLEQVASEVGYQDAFSFSKVFKRTVGVSPAEFRRRDAQDKLHPWRIPAGASPLEAGA